MIDVLLARLKQGHRTMQYPDGPPPSMPQRFRSRPVFDAAKCPDGCDICAKACPTTAITVNGKPHVDLGRCLFCTDCLQACPTDAVRYSNDYRLATRQRSDLVVDPEQELKL